MSRITLEVDEQTLSTLRSMAAGLGVPLESVAGDAIRQAAEENLALRAAVEEGRRQIAAEQGLSHEELVAELRAWRRDRKIAA